MSLWLQNLSFRLNDFRNVLKSRAKCILDDNDNRKNGSDLYWYFKHFIL
jgi:hypothetical protein